jgi:hypothetical protein
MFSERYGQSILLLSNSIIYNLACLSEAINRYNVDDDQNYCKELFDFFTESNGGIIVFIACTELKI